MHAILETGGKQYRVALEQEFLVEKLAAEPGAVVRLDRVALVERDGEVLVGRPWVPGATVACRVVAHGKGRKTEAFFYKAKENWKWKRGHRQRYTRLRVEEITVGGEGAKEG